MERKEVNSLKLDLFYLASLLDKDGGREVALEVVVELLNKLNKLEVSEDS